MSTTSQFTTFSDLYLGLLKALRTDAGDTATVEQAKRYINTAHLDIHLGFAENVPWAIRDHSAGTGTTFTATVATATGTAIDSNTGVISHLYTVDNPNLGLAGADSRISVTTSADGTTLGIEGVIGGVAATDPSNMTMYGPEIGVGDTIRVFKDDLVMPTDFLRLAGNQIKVGSRSLDLIGRVEFRHRFAGEINIGRPQYATLVDSVSIDGGMDERKIRLHPIPNTVERVFISYVTKNIVTTSTLNKAEGFSDDADVSIMPLRYRHAILFHALYHWYRDRKDDQRSQEAKAEYSEIMGRIVNDTEAGQSVMSIRPNTNAYRRKSSRPYRSGGSRSRYDHGRFDRLE